jgi:hypothetical protein
VTGLPVLGADPLIASTSKAGVASESMLRVPFRGSFLYAVDCNVAKQSGKYGKQDWPAQFFFYGS